MRALTAEETAELLPYGLLVEALREVLHDKAQGTARAPERLSVPVAEGGVLLIMPAVDDQLAITKVVTVHPNNAALDLATTQGEVIVMEASTGRWLRLLDGIAVTGRRTAAVSLLAAELLAPDPDGALLVVGAGAQAQFHLAAFVDRFQPLQVFIHSRSPDRAQQLAVLAGEMGVDATQVSAVSEALPEASMIITATSSATPVLGRGVRSDAFIAAVGAHRPDTAELAPALVRSARVYVDTLEGARAEAGDLIQADVDWETVVPLEAALNGVNRPDGPVVFKSVGHALWDLAAARVVEREISARIVEAVAAGDDDF